MILYNLHQKGYEMSIEKEIVDKSNSWPFKEAKKLLKKINNIAPKKGYVLFETGYGPSGLPHIGTFGEVLRTSMVKKAFECISDIPAKLICFSDDLDGLRKIPENIPNKQIVEEDLNLPLTDVRDPFGTHKSFADHNNSILIDFLDRFGFKYEFVSSTDKYKSGEFNEILLQFLHKYDKIMEIMLPTLGEERQKTYSPFMPISKINGHVLQVPTLEINLKKETIVYEDQGKKFETSINDGNVKLQWKPDWAMRWCALEVDYEMHGKDLIPSANIAKKICKSLDNNSPEVFNYELFLDNEGQKISKSKGNGLSMEEWLSYANQESLSYFMFQKPQTAKRLFFDIIPKTVDEYYNSLHLYKKQTNIERINNPVWHIHQGNPPNNEMKVSFSMLLNLVSAASAKDKTTLWAFVNKYNSNLKKETDPSLDESIGFAIKYFNDFVKPKKKFRPPNPNEICALNDLSSRLADYQGELEAEELQKIVYSVGKENNFSPLREWFICIYEVLLGTSQGPRFGGFIALFGIRETIDLIEKAIKGKL